MFLLIGYGSTLHSDDGFAHVLIERLRSIEFEFELDFLSGIQLNIEWAEAISRASAVIFVDASNDLDPGEISFEKLQSFDGVDAIAGSSISHHCTPQTLLQLARLLFKSNPLAWLCTVGAETFALGESLTPCVDDALARVITLIADTLRAEYQLAVDRPRD
ncbi:MAG: hydrogenase maturation protease [Candidatus Obscuribacterales bacterium]|nr:hydrogenase maturation protease [Candidatus Obscuribacterales bacterium]